MSARNESVPVADEYVASFDDHYTLTGTYRVEDVLGALGAPWESFQVSAQPATPITSTIFNEDAAANTPSIDVKPER